MRQFVFLKELFLVVLLIDVSLRFQQPSSETHQRTSWHPRKPTGSHVAISGCRILVAAQAATNTQPQHELPRRPSMPTARTHQVDDLLEAQVDALRKQLAETRASLAMLSTKETDNGNSYFGSSAAGDVSSSPIAEHVLHQLKVQERNLRLAIATALQELNSQHPDGGRRLPEAEEHYRAVIAALESMSASLHRQTDTVTFPGSGAEPRSGPAAPQPVHSLGGSSSVRPLDEDVDIQITRLGVIGNLAALLLEAGRPHEGLRELDKVLEEAGALLDRPGSGLWCGITFNRGKALAAVGRISEAEEVYRDTALGAVGLDPNCFAKACAAMTRVPDDLLVHVRSAVQLAEVSGLRQRLSGVLDAAGSSSPPLGAPPVPRAADSEPSHTADLPGAGGGSGGGESGEVSAIGDNPFGDRSRGGWLAGIRVQELGWLYFALAKALDGMNAEAGEVWRVLEQGNSLLSSQQPYDPAHDWRQLHIVTGVFGGPLLRALAESGAGLEDKTAVFVVGLPRSGSTLVETILSSYSGVWAAGEDTALAPLTSSINKVLVKQGLSQPGVLTDFGRQYLREMQHRAVASGWDPNKPPVRIVDKMLRNLWLIGYIEMLLPRACIVHVVRHPLDVALSCYSQPFGYTGVAWSWQLDHIGEQIRMAAALTKHWQEVLAPGRVLTLHYEEVVMAPQVSARRLLSHCGLDWDLHVLQFQDANRTVATASVSQVRKPLYNTSVGRWRKYRTQMAALAGQIRAEILSYEADLMAALRVAEEETRRLQHQQQQHQQQMEDQQEGGGKVGTVEVEGFGVSDPSGRAVGPPMPSRDEL
ncbi:hypothetical protein Vretimale_15828 [Volvox reticuliferus]|uniref:protein-tyrosine sulfotransferase n=1 Tax=Volvox reticuliferus TaxID=1737510 RepID=A0A8J4FQ00_9CHLO|nr:hypothetical protein Vretifemale_12887 [Volvox reticuliferus]GIM12497.1 hypothetical protein Vretimale_15828 [Volvox reticuliferus]